MANMLENIGMAFIKEDREIFERLLKHVADTGREFRSYSDRPYLYKSAGTCELWVNLKKENGSDKYSIADFHTHASNNNVIDFTHTGIDVTPRDWDHCEHIGLLEPRDKRAGMLPIDIFNADVLPSFLQGDKIRLQLAAFPLNINYYKDEDEYNNSRPKDDTGKSWGAAIGSMLPLFFLENHCSETYDAGKDYETDMLVNFTATVKKLYYGFFGLGDEKEKAYIRCVADTNYGEMEFSHAFDAVPEEMRDNIMPGAIIDGVCIVSGDAAIDKYGKGAVYDEENDIKLLRYVLSKGKAEKLRGVLKETTEYYSAGTDTVYKGIDEIIGRIQYEFDEKSRRDIRPWVYHMVIVDTESDNLCYSAGKCCLGIADDEDEDVNTLLFVDVDDDGKIDNIRITDSTGYHVDFYYPDNILPPRTPGGMSAGLVSAMMMRALTEHNIIDKPIGIKDFIDKIDDFQIFKNNAALMLGALKESDEDNIETAIRNCFGYLFVKALENEYVAMGYDSDANSELISRYSPSDAYKGICEERFASAAGARAEEAMDIGRSFYDDFFKEFTEKNCAADKDELFISSAIIVQQMGHLYAPKFWSAPAVGK